MARLLPRERHATDQWIAEYFNASATDEAWNPCCRADDAKRRLDEVIEEHAGISTMNAATLVVANLKKRRFTFDDAVMLALGQRTEAPSSLVYRVRNAVTGKIVVL